MEFLGEVLKLILLCVSGLLISMILIMLVAGSWEWLSARLDAVSADRHEPYAEAGKVTRAIDKVLRYPKLQPVFQFLVILGVFYLVCLHWASQDN